MDVSRIAPHLAYTASQIHAELVLRVSPASFAVSPLASLRRRRWISMFVNLILHQSASEFL